MPPDHRRERPGIGTLRVTRILFPWGSRARPQGLDRINQRFVACLGCRARRNGPTASRGLRGQTRATIERTVALDRDPVTTMANFFNYCTILSNIFCAVVLLLAAWPLTSQGSRPRDTARPACLPAQRPICTSPAWPTTCCSGASCWIRASPCPWSNEVMHLLVPVVTLLDALFDPRPRALPWKSVALALTFPPGLARIHLDRLSVRDDPGDNSAVISVLFPRPSSAGRLRPGRGIRHRHRRGHRGPRLRRQCAGPLAARPEGGFLIADTRRPPE